MEEAVLHKQMDMSSYGGRYLTFFLGDEEYGLEIKFVKEIIKVLQITAVPHSENYLLGVINLRGKVVPIMDLGLKVSLPMCQPTDRSCIVVIEYEHELVGVLVDAISEVVDIKKDEFDKTTFLDQNIDEQYISGVGKIAGKIKILLNIKNILVCEGGDIV